MTKQPWHTKSQHDNRKLKQVKEPGECVSVDQLESSIPGFIPQLKGKLTKQRYHAAMVFVDHYSGLSYIHMQRQLTSVETLEAKHACTSTLRQNQTLSRQQWKIHRQCIPGRCKKEGSDDILL